LIGTPAATYSLTLPGNCAEAGLDAAADPMFDGVLSKLSALDLAGASLKATAGDPRSPPGQLGRRPLRAAVLHGWPDTRRTAVLITQGVLGGCDSTDGKPLATRPGLVPANEKCHAIGLGQGFGFVCGSEGGRTTVHEFEPPLGLRPVLSFREPRFVSAGGNGALAIRGGCSPT